MAKIDITNDFQEEFEDSSNPLDDFDELDPTEDPTEDPVEIPKPEPKPLKSVSNLKKNKKKSTTEESTPLTDKERQDLANNLKKSRELPRLPVEKRGGKVDKRTFFEWINLLGDSHWSRILIYVYRIFPKIDRTLKYPNGDKNIDIISEGITENDFLGRHGGGKYRFIVTDTEAENRNDNKLFVCEPEWAWHETPPVLDYETLLMSDKDNKAYVSWATAKGVLSPPTTNTGERDDSGLKDITKTLLNNFLEDRKRPREEAPKSDNSNNLVIAKLLENQSPDKQITLITNLLTLLKPSAPEISFKDILELTQKQAAERESLILKFLQYKEEQAKEKAETQEPPKSLIEQLKEAKETAQLLGLGPKASGEGEWVDKLLNNPVVGALAAMGLQFMQQRMQSTPQVATNPPAQIASPFAMQTPGVAPITPNPTPTPLPSMETDTNMLNLDPRVAMLKSAIQVVAQPMLNTINKGETGTDFALWVIDGYGRQAYDAITSVGAEPLLEVIKTMPEVWNVILQTGNEQKFTKMLSEFCDRDGVDKALAGEDDEEEVTKPVEKVEDLF